MLKSLELFGFKSFADRTVLEFADGVTCVVGPNGSGKSNVVDAIKWILGDQSAKSLRGKEMSDVIFNGSAGRKPSNFAEATLTFDNSTGLLPLEMSEVRIGRRLYASGDSEYLLNGSPVRLKDIREMFMGTGAGTAAYSIIEQGRVDQILQANPTTRRGVFEEAAGVSRFKSRRIEAQRRLERVDTNLLRLRDIVDQVESRLNATRSQASKAAKYRQYMGEYERLWTGLAADDYRAATAQLAEVTSQLEEQHRHIAAADAELAKREAYLNGLDTQSVGLDDQIRMIERRRSAGREVIARHETTVRHQTTQHHELAAEIERLRGQRNALRRQLQSVGTQLDDTKVRLATIEADFATQRDALVRRELRIELLGGRLASARRAIDQRRAEQEVVRRARTANEQQRAALQLRLEATVEMAGKTARRAVSLMTDIETARSERELRSRQLRIAEEAVAAAQARIDHARQDRRQLQSAQGAGERQLATWREERSAKLARRQLLEDLEERQEGLNLGVREILHLAASATERPWSLIRGTVGDLLQAELNDAPLLEVALGPRVQLLVIDDLGPMIRYLNTAMAEIAGRVGFLQVPEASDALVSAWDLSGEPGVMARADRLVTDCPVPALAASLLADTWVVESLDVAWRLSNEAGLKCRFVTLQGELLEPDGTLFVGTTSAETSVISRKSELRLLRNEIRALTSTIDSAEEALQQLDASLMETDGELAELQAESNRCLEELADKRSAHAAQAADCERLLESRAAADAEIERLEAEQASLHEQIAAVERAMAADEESTATVAAAIGEAESLAVDIDAQLHEQRQETKTEQLEHAKHEERLVALQANHLRLAEDRRQQERQVQLADRQFQASLAKQWEIAHAILSTRAALAELFLADDAHLVEVRRLHRQRDELSAERRRMHRDQDRLRDRRRDLTDSVHALEMQGRDLRHALTSLSTRIEEEFGRDLSQIVEREASAYREWCNVADDEEPGTEAGDDVTVGGAGKDEANSVAGAGSARSDNSLSGDASADANELSPVFDDVRGEIEDRVERLRRKIKNLGSVNADSLNDLDELEQRFTDLSSQLADLEAAKAALEDIIRRINLESRRLFLATFNSIRQHFRELYRKLFGGGEGDIVLEDPDDVLECGIDIVARPPGKELRSISLLSGGEKTMTAVALLFAMFRSKPSPYCILDEVDASLDEANVDRYVSVVKEFCASTQFVIITHRKRTMAAADQLYGVTMEEAGVSKRLNVAFEDVREDGHFRSSKTAA